MKLIVITLPKFFTCENPFSFEANLINKKFEGADKRFPNGLEILHLRKPGASLADIEALIQNIKPEYYNRIVLHDAFELCQKYGLRGVHLNSRNSLAPNGVRHISRSCHSLEEVTEILSKVDMALAQYDYSYVFLSPIFDSISKEGYGAAFSDDTLRQAAKSGIINDKVYALGGVDFSKLEYLEELGFGGAAMLGAAWSL